jgi:Cu(I)/Ag(I) efflux system membrane fusion protein
MTGANRAVLIAVVSCAFVASVGAGYWWGRSRDDAPTSTTPSTPSPGRKVLYWYDPMKPGQRFEKPGKSPYMDMQLLPKYADDVAEGGISIAPGVRQNVGIRTVMVKRGQLTATLSVPGTIGWDLRQERIVSARVDSIVERLHVRAPFELVSAGQPLASVIAPTWSTALAEAHALGQASSAPARSLQSAAQARLRVLGLPAGASAGGARITLMSPVTGVVSEIGVREGQSAPTGTLLFRVNGTRTVWLEAAIPQAGIAGVAAGTPIEATVDARPGETFHGRVEILLPQIDMGSRTQRARIVLDNPDGQLVPGMFAQITLRPPAGAEHPLVPTDALIGAGPQARVIVLGANDSFRPVIVQAGRSSGGMTEILAGLKGGEKVVASGQFLIDSEANLSGALDRLGAGTVESTGAGEQDEAMPGHVMPGMPVMEVPTPPRVAPTRPTPAVTAPKKTTSTERPESPEREVLYWYDPMRPDQHFDKPGKSPYMDMQLVPKYADEVEVSASEPQP